MGLVIAMGAIFKLLSKAFVLLHRIVQFAECVAQLEAATVKLEAFYPIRVVGILLGERRDCGWKFVDDCGLDEV